MVEIVKNVLTVDIETLDLISDEEMKEIRRICNNIAGRKRKSIREACGES